MLAEKRVKQKWGDDPRNTRWSRDRSKYGYRMLQQMGWREGQGLGKELVGRRDHVMPTRRDGNTGVGFKKSRDDSWIEQQESFEQILADLNTQKEHVPDTQAKSLLSTAVNTGRAVYKKVLCSKDLSAVNSDELDCVMGRRGRDGEKRHNQNRNENRELDELSLPIVSHGITTITHKTTMQEYFADKLANCNIICPTTTNTPGGIQAASCASVSSVKSDSGVCGEGSGELHVATEDCVDAEPPPRKKKKRTKAKKQHKHV